MKIDVLTLFPEMFAPLDHSIVGRARTLGQVEVQFTNFRDFSTNKHHKVDDAPYGGGAGMLLTPQPMFDAFDSLAKSKPRVIVTTPTGRPFNQRVAEEWANEEHLIFLCGHYEGFDQRIHDELATDEVSIGDFVMTGGELAAMVMIDATVRLIPEVLGDQASHEDDSFSTGLLEYPHYTRPADFRGLKVPDVLLSGNHAKIESWRRERSLERTFRRRPELLDQIDLSPADKNFIESLRDS
ncbi:MULTISPECIES: tRNA (guanosine(37)-N1)-methyltransferase TrmD [unclassified Exiguobacterium]|uniref:tRNA (guanosine(37)-N1)-methyltransferase TrmD n=1 Tax=unclassified Exiguobacterium TaxID=2644629 RepID=UPI00103A9873|nr:MULTISPECIES: tRNA (guanosine(37)-N1)-methyltransferase TrmD [unclassified Exiguobacterium]TCI37371.1 tRNA (guanosine(37)-N1)-methyltransferase TrmD [Exiguobacterium sp. SH4S7]TCI45502.1 tRNA (guanosine(37)-N1)-methyltransferase TrmD [Exiguobacterium sp. SH5S32]TCI52703.1 tRNA (guanosine(37)-N1)-methyltransferase TrmD [Exiguobacterium sp. SH1S4]TCI65474.1 tRNA (guanosine(37)-N1)-methyltransferase TrmD [Exiguobacterium sp. SH0S2]TCI70892.1 tRNA (guanosine(37)-N1)-methyltransferase TrmD [Exig